MCKKSLIIRAPLCVFAAVMMVGFAPAVMAQEDAEPTEDEMIQEIVGGSSGIDKEDLEKIRDKEYRYYSGSASNDSGEAIESYLCEAEFDIDTETLKIKGGGGY